MKSVESNTRDSCKLLYLEATKIFQDICAFNLQCYKIVRATMFLRNLKKIEGNLKDFDKCLVIAEVLHLERQNKFLNAGSSKFR